MTEEEIAAFVLDGVALLPSAAKVDERKSRVLELIRLSEQVRSQFALQPTGLSYGDVEIASHNTLKRWERELCVSLSLYRKLVVGELVYHFKRRLEELG